MSVSRAANAAIDKVAPQFDEVAALIAEYGGTDLLCYRAEEPDELAEAQARAWENSDFLKKCGVQPTYPHSLRNCAGQDTLLGLSAPLSWQK